MYSSSGRSNIGMFFEFDDDVTVLKSHVGISFNKEAGKEVAKINLINNYPKYHQFDLDWSIKNSLKSWNDKLFSKIHLNEDNEDPIILTKLYNALYGTHFMPTNKSGLDSPWNDNQPYYDDWFTLWGTFRCLHPLINILSKDYGAEMVRALVNIWEHEGFMPDGRSGGRSGRTQGGSNSDILVADAYTKHINDGIDWEKSFKAMYSNAEIEPPYVKDAVAPDSTNKYGRGALSDWLRYGYVTRNYSRSVTRTMEYSYNDFALSIVAKGLGKEDLAARYSKRSKNWRNIWNFDAVSSNKRYQYRGFVQPRNSDGSFNYDKYDPFSCYGCYWKDDEYEGKPVEYGWAVPYDMRTLLAFIGSEEIFERRLDDMFSFHGYEDVADIGNEPSFLTPYLYNYINKQDKTSSLVDWIIKTKFKTGPHGLPGNSDAGAMQAWLLFSLIGFYPIAGTDIYLLTSPKLTYLRIANLHNSPEVEIICHDLYRDGLERNVFIQKVLLNGMILNRNWFKHDELFIRGGKLEYFMSKDPIGWDSSGERPPSYYD